jgi:AcrR family transcriptional regulator
VSEGTCGFQRARRPEQREARRQAILDAAAAMLAEFPVNDISLRELSRRVGLAKSNVLRYFETREEVFLELLDRSGREWLDELAERLVQISDDSDPVGRVAAELAGSLTARPLFCELVSAMASVLERNISVDVARRFKLRMMETATVLVGLLREHVPGLTEEGAGQFVAALLALVAGLWPFAHPTDAVRAAIEELGLDASHLDFAASLREAAATHLTGVLARYAVRP